MNFLSNPTVARLLWFFPVLLFVIAGSLLMAGLDIRRTLESGESVRADVLDIYTLERSEYTDAHLTVRYVMPGSEETREERLTLPLTLVKHLGEPEHVMLRVMPESRPVVVEIARPQWRMALIQSVFALFGAVGLSIMVGAWNRLLRRRGDPALAEPSAA